MPLLHPPESRGVFNLDGKEVVRRKGLFFNSPEGHGFELEDVTN